MLRDAEIVSEDIIRYYAAKMIPRMTKRQRQWDCSDDHLTFSKPACMNSRIVAQGSPASDSLKRNMALHDRSTSHSAFLLPFALRNRVRASTNAQSLGNWCASDYGPRQGDSPHFGRTCSLRRSPLCTMALSTDSVRRRTSTAASLTALSM